MLRIYISLGCRITSHEYSFTCNQFKHTLYDQLLRFSLAIISRVGMCSPFFSVVRFLVPTITIFFVLWHMSHYKCKQTPE